MVNYKKVSAIATSLLMAGLSVGTAMAASWPDDFTSGAVVYGASAAASDSTQANSIANYLESESSTSTFSLSETVTEIEVPLREDLVFSGSDLGATTGILDDSDLAGLIDKQISWDDGTGSSDYDVHEEIRITDGDMKVLTTLDDEDLEGPALSTAVNGLKYRYVFDDQFNATSGIGATGADTLYLTILGKQYEIESATATSITVITSDEYVLAQGESVTVDGTVYTVEAIGSTSVRVNGEVLSTSTEKIDGLDVKVKTGSIFYDENDVSSRSVTLQIGEDITDTFTNGDEYLGQDKDDPLWTWEIVTLDTAGGYIGVAYNANLNDADDVHEPTGEMIKYAGESYVFPENFAEVKLEGVTDVSYSDFTVKFTEVDLYNATANQGAQIEDAKVIEIAAPSNDLISTPGSNETGNLYIYYQTNTTATDYAGVAPVQNGSINVYFKDANGDFGSTSHAVYEAQNALGTDYALAETNVGTITVGDTVLHINVTVSAGAGGAGNGAPALTLEIADSVTNATWGVKLNASGDAMDGLGGTLEYLGVTKEDADANDIKVDDVDVSTKDYQIMDAYGLIVGGSSGIESDADSDEIEISIPDDRVYGIASVSLIEGAGSAGSMVFKDSEKSSWQNKDVVLVGGSCVNTAAAEALGVASNTCEAAFTSATTVGEGKFLIQKVDDAFTEGKVALVVAGYEAADTNAAATRLINQPTTVDLDSNAKYIGVTGSAGASTISAVA